RADMAVAFCSEEAIYPLLEIFLILLLEPIICQRETQNIASLTNRPIEVPDPWLLILDSILYRFLPSLSKISCGTFCRSSTKNPSRQTENFGSILKLMIFALRAMYCRS